MATSTTMEFDAFEVTDLSTEKRLTGTVEETINVNNETKTVHTHMHRSFPNENTQDLVNITSVYNGFSYHYTGTLFDGKYGKVDLNTDQEIFYGGYNLPAEGVFLLTGALKSKLKIIALGVRQDEVTGSIDPFYQVSVDADGDSIFESESVTGN